MSEQKSLPRRGRSRYHHQQYQFSTNTTPRHHNSSKNNNMNTTSGNNSKILSPRGVCGSASGGGGVSISGSGGGGGNLKSISSTFKSQDSIQCHIPTLVKSPSVTQQQHQQQLQKHQHQLQKTNVTTNATTNSFNSTNSSSCSSSIATSNKNKLSQQPLLITPKIAHHPQHHNLIGAPHPTTQLSQSDTTTDLLDSSCNNPIASLGPVTCMPSSQFRPIPHKTVPASVANASVSGESVGTILNPSTAPLSSKFFSATTLPK